MSESAWYEVCRYQDGVTVVLESGHSENVRAYLIEGSERTIVFDTGMGVGDFSGLVQSLTQNEVLVVLSHTHFDHIGAAAAFDNVLVHESEADLLRIGYPNVKYRPWFEPEHMRGTPLPEGFDPDTAAIAGTEPSGFLRGGEVFDIGGRTLEVYHTPGHSPGGLSLFDPARGSLFPGDVVHLGALYAHRSYSDPAAYRESLRLLADLAGKSRAVYPSHGTTPILPADVLRIHEAFEEIWAGREPDAISDERHHFVFEGFTFDLPPGRYGG